MFENLVKKDFCCEMGFRASELTPMLSFIEHSDTYDI